MVSAHFLLFALSPGSFDFLTSALFIKPQRLGNYGGAVGQGPLPIKELSKVTLKPEPSPGWSLSLGIAVQRSHAQRPPSTPSSHKEAVLCALARSASSEVTRTDHLLASDLDLHPM